MEQLDNGHNATVAKPQATSVNFRGYTGEILLRTRPKTYREIVRLLTEGVSNLRISQLCRVTEKSVVAVALRESADITARKRELVHMVTDIAHIGAARVADTIGKASCRDAVIGTGVAIDKALALLGQTPTVQIANVVLPNDQERAERRALHDKLDEITQRLKAHNATQA